MKCNLCNSEDNEVIFDYTRFEKNNVLKCKKCGLVFLENMKSAGFYKKEYRETEVLPKIAPEVLCENKITKQDAESRMRFIKRYIPSINRKRILEVGCASGGFLTYLKKEGAIAEGLDLDESYLQYAKNRGFKTYNKPLEENNFDNEFDIIISWFTLEHMEDPKAFLEAVNKALKKGGLLFLEVPNQDDWRIKIFENYVVKRFHYDPFHNYYFSPETIENYLEYSKFRDINMETYERYNSYLQLSRIINKEYVKENAENILKSDIFGQLESGVKIDFNVNPEIKEFNQLFEKGTSLELMGNCLYISAVK